MRADNRFVAGESMTLMSTHRVTTTRGEFLDAIRNAFADAASEGCRELWICDLDFADWPLSERPVIESLTRWAYAHRKLTVLATTYEEFPRWNRPMRCTVANSLMRFRNDRAKPSPRPRSVSRELLPDPYNRGLGIGNARAFLVFELGSSGLTGPPITGNCSNPSFEDKYE
jgi:hypothetical protein